PGSYRPQLLALEERLPLGDALLGTLLGSALIAPRLLDDFGALDKLVGQLDQSGSIGPWFAEPGNQKPAAVHSLWPGLETRPQRWSGDSSANPGSSETRAVAPRPDWATLTNNATSRAMLRHASLWGSNVAYLGQSAGLSFFGTQRSDASLVAIHGV